MTAAVRAIGELADHIQSAPRKSDRRLVALAGAPGSGKSTVADQLAQTLTERGCPAAVVPMDGFHLDNRILQAQGLLPHKGAPETFDARGFGRLAAALGAQSPVYYPLFERARDIAIAGAGVLQDKCDTVIIEGNYLLFDAPDWRDLVQYWDVSVHLEVPMPVLRDRLIARWLNEGFSETDAIARAQGNDLENARRIAANRLPGDLEYLNDTPVGYGAAEV